MSRSFLKGIVDDGGQQCALRSRHLSGAKAHRPQEAAGMGASEVTGVSLVHTPGLNTINKSWWAVVVPAWSPHQATV